MVTVRPVMEARETSRSSSARATSPSQIRRPDEVRSTPAVRAALLRVEGEYREMPGLCLTLPQASRLCGLDLATCELVLMNLIDRGVLKRAVNGTYIRQ